jgi:hypothetical protein
MTVEPGIPGTCKVPIITWSERAPSQFPGVSLEATIVAVSLSSPFSGCHSRKVAKLGTAVQVSFDDRFLLLGGESEHASPRDNGILWGRT